MRGWSFTTPFFFINNYLSSMRKSSMRGRSFTSLSYQEVPEFSEEVLHEGKEPHLPFFIINYLSSMRKSFMRGRSVTSLFINNYLSSMRKSSMRGRCLTIFFHQQIPELYEEAPQWGGGASPPILINNYLSSMRKSSLRGRSFISLSY